jgi:ABC-type antimicrobial peptide transport system permease subunit
VLFGLAVSPALGRFIRASLYGITSSNPLAFAASIAIMAVVAILAGYVAARRGERVDPAAALRQA